MEAVIVAGGAVSDEGREVILAALLRAGLVVAADSGADVLVTLGRRPDLMIGDLDSVAPGTRALLEADGVETLQLPVAKDETDTEAALRLVVDRGADAVTIFGALGGPRLDHLVGNLLLLTAPWLSACRVRLRDECHEVFVAGGDATVEGSSGDLVSLLPLTPVVQDVRTAGLAYPLLGEPLHQGATRGVSNVLLAHEGRVSHGEGVLLVVHYTGSHHA